MPFYQRKSPRLQNYDYSQSGAYFLTICTHHRQYYFGDVQDGEMVPSSAGNIAAVCWNTIPEHYPDVDLDAFVAMPNHVHGIIVLKGNLDFKTVVGRVINGYKGAVTARIRHHQPDLIVWQSRYYDHVIRSEDSLNRLRTYIEENPARWEEDKLFGTE